MTDTGKNSILLGYALTYAAGVSAFTAMSMLFTFVRRSAHDVDVYTVTLLTGIKFAWVFGYALGFVLLAAALDFLTKRSPQPMSALSLGLAAFATIDLLQQVLFINAYTGQAVIP